MASIKKPYIKAYVLLESLITMALLAILANLVLTEISTSRRDIARQNQQIEAINVGLMAFDSGQENLTLNGVTVHVVKSSQKVVIRYKDEEVISLEVQQKKP